jgi:hypothetical protein
MGKCGCTGKKYKYKPTGKMIKQIHKMAPGKKIGGQMVHPMSATKPYGITSAFTKLVAPIKKTSDNVVSTIKKVANDPTVKKVVDTTRKVADTAEDVVSVVDTVRKFVTPSTNFQTPPGATPTTKEQSKATLPKEKKDKGNDVGYRKGKKIVKNQYTFNFGNNKAQYPRMLPQRYHNRGSSSTTNSSYGGSGGVDAGEGLGKYVKNAKIYSNY